MALKHGLKSFAAVKAFVRSAKRQGKTVVTTNGCFDILHVGHIRLLAAARAQGDVLVVGVNSDASVRTLKGKGRPVVPALERAEIIGSLSAVDAAFVFSGKDPRKWLAVLKPDIHAKGSDRRMAEIIEGGVVRAGGGRVILLPIYKKGPTNKKRSTTELIGKIRRA